MVFQRIKKLFVKKQLNGSLDDEARAKALETRRIKQQIDQAEKRLELNKRLAALETLAKGGDDSLEKTFFSLVANWLMQPKAAASQGLNNSSALLSSGCALPEGQHKAIADRLVKFIPDDYKTLISSLTNDDLIKIKDEVLSIWAVQVKA